MWRVVSSFLLILVISVARAAPITNADEYCEWREHPKTGEVICELREQIPGESPGDGGTGPLPIRDDPENGGDPPSREQTPYERWMAANCTVVATNTPPETRADGSVWREYLLLCSADGSNSYTADTFWARVPAPGDPAPVPPPDPERLVRMLWDSMRQVVPAPTVHVAPAETDPDGYAYVQTPAFFWVDEWLPLSKSLTLGPTTVTLTVEPVRLDVDLGNGETLTCVDPPAFPPGARVDTFDGCGYVYRHSSATAPNGSTFEVAPTLTWQVRWSSNQGDSGGFDGVTTQGDSLLLPVAEIQAIVTNVGG
jgi:hypothetical protein